MRVQTSLLKLPVSRENRGLHSDSDLRGTEGPFSLEALGVSPGSALGSRLHHGLGFAVLASLGPSLSVLGKASRAAVPNIIVNAEDGSDEAREQAHLCRLTEGQAS